MSLKTIQGILAAAVADGGTVAINYPTGYTRGDFIPGVDHRMVVNQFELKSPNKITLSFGATQVTVTNKTGATWAINSPFILQLEIPGADSGQLAIDGKTRMPRVTPWPIRYLDLGTPAALSAAGIRVAAAVGAAGPLANLLVTALDVPRALTILSAGNDSGITFTVLGKGIYDQTITEVITGANAGTAAGKKAFTSITSITASAAAAGNVSVGWGNVLGLPGFLPNAKHILAEFQDGAAATAGTTVAGDLTYPSATTGDIRGTYIPNAAPDGTKAYGLLCALPDPGFLGAENFAG
jgi:hypothetical protein